MNTPPDEFAARLKAAKDRQAVRNGAGSSVADRRGMGAGMRITVDLVAAIAVGTGMGWVLDRWLGTRPWLMVLFLVLGFAAGILNVMRTARSLDEASRQEEAAAKADATKES